MTSTRDMPAWHEGLEPVWSGLPVGGGAAHGCTWAAGVFTLDDHDDPESERALAALGGDRCPCLEVLDAWEAQSEAPEILAVGQRSARDHVGVATTVVSRVERDVQRWRQRLAATAAELRAAGDTGALARLQAAAAPAERRVAVRLGFVRLLGLETRLQDRLQLTVLANAEARWGDEAFRTRNEARLAAALDGRARPALAGVGLHPDTIELLAPGDDPVVDRRRVALPLSWLTNVWGRGVALDRGRFVTRVTAVDDDGKVLVVQGVDEDDWRIQRA